MKLNLKKPIVFFDLESTGIDVVKDRIVEISIIRVEPNGNESSKTMRINPQMPIPAGASEVHGIYDKDIVDCPTFKEAAAEISPYFEGADIAGFNSNRFDVPMLAEEFLRAGISINLKRNKLIDVQVVFHKMEQRTLSAAYQFYCDKDLTDAHSAEADTRATYEVLKAQLDKYPNLKNDMDFLSDFTSYSRNVDFAGRIVYNDKDEAVINFGKHKGRPVTEVLSTDPGYYSWMLNSDFPLFTKKVMTEIKLGVKK